MLDDDGVVDLCFDEKSKTVIALVDGELTRHGSADLMNGWRDGRKGKAGEIKSQETRVSGILFATGMKWLASNLGRYDDRICGDMWGRC